MESFDVWQLLGNLLAIGVCGGIWLLICKAVPPLRRRIDFSYGSTIAVVLFFAWSTSRVSDIPTAPYSLGVLALIALVAWQWRRAKRLGTAPVTLPAAH